MHTVKNLFAYVITFLKRCGKSGLVKQTGWPKAEHNEYDPSTDEAVHKRVAACETDKERVLILVYQRDGVPQGRNRPLRKVRHSLHGQNSPHAVQAQTGVPHKGLRGANDSSQRHTHRGASFANSAIGSNSHCALIVHERANFRSGWMSPLSAALIASRYFARASPSLSRLTEPQVNAGWPTLIKSMSAISRACLPLPFGKG